MIKRLKKACIVSGVINIWLMIVNIIFYALTQNLLIRVTMQGGEIIESVGFGLYVKKLYSMTGGVTTECTFEPISLIVTFILVVVFYLIIDKVTDVKEEEVVVEAKEQEIVEEAVVETKEE